VLVCQFHRCRSYNLGNNDQLPAESKEADQKQEVIEEGGSEHFSDEQYDMEFDHSEEHESNEETMDLQEQPPEEQQEQKETEEDIKPSDEIGNQITDLIMGDLLNQSVEGQLSFSIAAYIL
jgi:hypothetical protein